MKLDTYINRIIEHLATFTPKFIMAIVVFLVGLWLIRRIAALAQKGFEQKNLDVSLRTFLKSLISIGLKIVLIVTVAGMLGIGTASFVTILGAAGLAVGLALQGSLSNFAGGVLLLIFKPYKVGDTIEAQGQTGEVKEIQIFNTLVLTGEHKTVIFPNGVLSNGTIINHTKHGNLRAEIKLSVAIENDISKIKTIIREVLEANALILNNPGPQISVGQISDGAVSILIKPFCLPEHSGAVVSDLNESLKIAFEKNGVILPVHSMIVHNINS